MADDQVSATKVIDAPAEAIFAVLADPVQHAAIDGTGWVREARDAKPLTAAGQIFRMSMYHPGHPDGNYQMANRVQLFNRPSTISWEPGSEADDGVVTFPGWVWRYDLTPGGPSKTTVTLTYDWSAVPDHIREHIGFPPFPPEHLGNSLAHFAELVAKVDRVGD
ncbi:MAG: polyketide cyclase [Actinomycetota bacterium]|nr:polyketide cyclase [Actinomycetota bacterium]